ncbi:hypothetical protein DCC85_08465 [Paenibacillus sp. CAA11]|uniref:hypothetical protein n=1 Tax=Paenibacillus sp. CAA11 TaxID=1532905 RepID=UPI000D3AB145|nr:hypothetical protein [Paenibacillus sp. CAA11]AWB44245.1 hypothetical protein DCC85_08465 [Paenibacillus sp. CAA11]
MKKKFSLILSFALLFAFLLPLSSVSAYEGGVLNGKELSYGKGYVTEDTTSLVTDNEDSTMFKLDPGKQIWFEFKIPVQLIAYQLKVASGDATKLGMGYSRYSGAHYTYFSTPLVADGNKTYGNSYNDVHFFKLVNSGTSPVYISEFDVFINSEYYELTPPTNLVATPGNSLAKLKWDQSEHSTLYNLYRSETKGGPYKLVTSTSATYYSDSTVTNDITYYYVVTSIDKNGESSYSNEALVTPSINTNTPEPEPNPQPSGDRAILTITMTNGSEKEFDLSMSEVNSFINWYDAKEAGTGPAKYGIDKHSNNKGPFSKRVEYVIFKNILSFEVDEYNTVTTPTK